MVPEGCYVFFSGSFSEILVPFSQKNPRFSPEKKTQRLGSRLSSLTFELRARLGERARARSIVEPKIPIKKLTRASASGPRRGARIDKKGIGRVFAFFGGIHCKFHRFFVAEGLPRQKNGKFSMDTTENESNFPAYGKNY